jgi:type II secretory pathway pseudopilin PulG
LERQHDSCSVPPRGWGAFGSPQTIFWGASIAAALLAAGAYVAQIIAGADISQGKMVSLAVVGAIATAAALLLASAQAASEARERREAEAAASDAERLAADAVTKFQVALNDIFLPFSDLLAKAVTARNATDTAAVRGEAKRAAVNYVARFVNADRVRSCFFEYKSANGRQWLECDNIYDGRSEAPKTVFRRSNPNDAHVFELLDTRSTEFWPDLTKQRPPGFPTNRRYKTFISAPVATRFEVYGLLTVDALNPGDLSEDDEPFIRLFAQLLAIALRGNAPFGGSPTRLPR